MATRSSNPKSVSIQRVLLFCLVDDDDDDDDDDEDDDVSWCLDMANCVVL